MEAKGKEDSGEANGRKKATIEKEYFWLCDLPHNGGEKVDTIQVNFHEDTIKKPGRH